MTTAGGLTEYTLPAASTPFQIAAGPDGNLWFTETYNNKIGKITTAGAFTEYAMPTAGAGPLGIAAGPDGNLWFTEFYADKIGRITPAGVVTEYSKGLTVPNGTTTNVKGITAGPSKHGGTTMWFTETNANLIGNILP
jgi:streptogramin lyase